jgi:hypothetical protein
MLESSLSVALVVDHGQLPPPQPGKLTWLVQPQARLTPSP